MEDVYENILLNFDIDTLQNACSTNKNHKICNNFNFWIAKFRHDNLPILALHLPETINQWIKEYKKVLKAADKTDYVYSLVINGEDLYIKYDFFKKWPINYKTPMLIDLLPKELVQTLEPEFFYGSQVDINMLNAGNNIELRLFRNRSIINYMIIDEDDFIFMLTRLLYYIPTLNILNSNHESFR
jgi:hypothetical protein